MEDSANALSSIKENAMSENEIYDKILANLDEADAATMYPIKEEFPSYEKNFTYEEIKDPSLRSVINDHNYISSEDTYSRDVRQNLIDFVQLTNSTLVSNLYATEAQVETLIDSVLSMLSKVTDYDMAIDKIKGAGTVCEKDSTKTEPRAEIENHLNKEDDKAVEDVFLQELGADIKLELSAFIKMEGGGTLHDIEAPLVDKDEEDVALDEPNDDEISELDKQIEMILGKEEEEDEDYPFKTKQTEQEQKLALEKTNNIVISKVEYTYDPNFEQKKGQQKSSTLDAQIIDILNNKTELLESKIPGPPTTDPPKEHCCADAVKIENSEDKQPTPLEVSPEERSSPVEDINNDKSIEKSTSEEPELGVRNENATLNKMESSESTLSQEEIPSVVKELLKFAEQLKEDYEKFYEKPDFNLEDFIALKYKEHRNIINSVLFKDSSMQTEKVISKKKLRKMNALDKRHLLESSNDSDSSNSSYMDKTSNEFDAGYKKSSKTYFSGNQSTSKESLVSKKSAKDSKYFRSDYDDSDEEEILQSNASLESLSRHESDDSEHLLDTEKKKIKPKVTRSLSEDGASISSSSSSIEKLNIKTEDRRIQKNTNESDKENRDSVTSSESCESKKSKQDENIEDDAQEKEIERLLNLKGLVEPQKNTSSVNYSKQKSSSKLLSSKTDSLFDVMQEIDRNSMSDDSIGEVSSLIFK